VEEDEEPQKKKRTSWRDKKNNVLGQICFYPICAMPNYDVLPMIAVEY
jgi:hypothetical protein